MIQQKKIKIVGFAENCNNISVTCIIKLYVPEEFIVDFTNCKLLKFQIMETIKRLMEGFDSKIDFPFINFKGREISH